MGARNFMHLVEGSSASEAYRTLVDEAIHEKGNDCYSGTIATTDNFTINRKHRFDKSTQKNKDKAYEIAEKRLENMGKRDCECIELGIKERLIYTAIKVKKTSKKKPKYETRFIISPYFYSETRPAVATTLKEAGRKAFELALANRQSYVITKERTLVSGQEDSYVIEITYKAYKSKPSRKLKPNEKLVTVKQYLFYGCAAE